MATHRDCSYIQTLLGFLTTVDDHFCPAAQKLIDRRAAEIAVCMQSGEPVEGLYLSHLLSSEHMSRAEVYTCITELLLGGVDTVSLDKIRRDTLLVLEMFCMPKCMTHSCVLGGCFILLLVYPDLVCPHSQGEVEACRCGCSLGATSL